MSERGTRPIGRVLRKRYRKYIEALVEAGASEVKIAKCVREKHRVDSAIAGGKCPECGRAIVRYGSGDTNARRTAAGLPLGPNLGVGGWVMYRCSSQKPPGEYDPDAPCRFMLDRFEAGEAN